nr:immunoglobulin heavy chain junction region [Mus musculus]
CAREVLLRFAYW